MLTPRPLSDAEQHAIVRVWTETGCLDDLFRQIADSRGLDVLALADVPRLRGPHWAGVAIDEQGQVWALELDEVAQIYRWEPIELIS